jgi:uncharacterized protein (DUF983 family)
MAGEVVSAVVVFVVVVEESVGIAVVVEATLNVDVMVVVVIIVEVRMTAQLARSVENTINRLNMAVEMGLVKYFMYLFNLL